MLVHQIRYFNCTLHMYNYFNHACTITGKKFIEHKQVRVLMIREAISRSAAKNLKLELAMQKFQGHVAAVELEKIQ